EQALIDLGYDDVLDNYVATDSINSVHFLPVSSRSISNLTGIEDFIALESLNASYNELTSLTLSNDAPMTGYLLCTNNQLTDLDVSAFTDLQDLGIGHNQLTSLDVSNNTALTRLDCSNNLFTTLDVINNTALSYLDCSGNALTALDVSANTSLTDLRCAHNDLTILDLSNNTALGILYCYYNALTALDVSQNTSLAFFGTENNNITSLDVSANTALVQLRCQNNQLTTLNMRNGVTDSLTTFYATNNANLTCIETLDPDYATTNWTNANGNIDEGVTFSVICGSEEQDVWHVATTGSDGSGNGTQESPFATIQTGINASGDGNTVQVAAGTYVENI
ncbi:uncharacterized protein METZ01_LOCUS332418, partial [marine metagenome]